MVINNCHMKFLLAIFKYIMGHIRPVGLEFDTCGLGLGEAETSDIFVISFVSFS